MASALHAQELWFPTSAPEFVSPRNPVAEADKPLFTREAYARLIAAAGSDRGFVPAREFPRGLSAAARIGINLVWDATNRSFVVDGDAARGFTVYADINANGTLIDDPPIEMERGEGYFIAILRTTVSDEGTRLPITYGIVVVPSHGDLKYGVYPLTIRRGVAQIGGRRVAFQLRGIGGSYDQPTNRIWVDIDDNGRGSDDAASGEFFHVREQRFNIGGASYHFRVDRHGRGLAVTPLGTSLPDRSSLKPGTEPPQFSAVDVEGRPQSLEQYRGRVVLLDFWAAWCGPCRFEAPVLRTMYQKHRGAGLAIIGISSDTVEEIRKFTRAERHPWPQIAEDASGEIHELFRIAAVPTHVLIGRDGKIVTIATGDLPSDQTFDELLTHALDAQ